MWKEVSLSLSLSLLNMAYYFDDVNILARRIRSACCQDITSLVEHLVRTLEHLRTASHSYMPIRTVIIPAAEDVLYLISKIGSDWKLPISEEQVSVAIDLITDVLDDLKFCVNWHIDHLSDSTYSNAQIARSGMEVVLEFYKKYCHLGASYDTLPRAILCKYEHDLHLETFDAKLKSYNEKVATKAIHLEKSSVKTFAEKRSLSRS